MLHPDVRMTDIDVNQWRNAQSLLLDSAKRHPRIVVIHEGGEVLKVVHSDRVPVAAAPSHCDDPHLVAKALYDSNASVADFVVVLERTAVDRYFAQVQDSWSIDEDLDAFVQRTYATLDEYADGIVAYPGKARSVLGLQWRLGASLVKVQEAAAAFVAPGTTAVFGVLVDDSLWASLIVRCDADHKVTLITTVDPAEINSAGDMMVVGARIVDWVERRHGPCSIGVFLDLASARALLAAPQKSVVLRDLVLDGRAVVRPTPAALAPLLVPA